MAVQHCSICGQLMPERTAGPTGGGAAADTVTPQASADATAPRAPASSQICTACIQKLGSSKHPERSDRTTVMRPSASERLTDKAVLAEENTQATYVDPPAAAGAAEPGQHVVTRSSSTGVTVELPPDGSKDGVAVPKRFGNYEIEREISRGSFGVVYRAKQQGLDRVVALKVLLAGVHASSEMVARFQREARAVARMKHPNIVPVYDIGTHEGHHYFAMEFVEGDALSELVTQKKVTIQRALEIAEALADALDTAHHAGVIHRDIKPSNILVDAQGQPHITDFGLAKQVDLDTKYTVSGTTLGTPAYMPPEQARGEIEKIDARSDVYAIGAVMYEMLTGQTPFAGRSLLEVVVAVINEPVRPPRQLNPRIHGDVQTIVMKCLEKDPRQRYESAADLRDDLLRFRSGEAIRARPAGPLRRAGRVLRRHIVTLGAVSVVAALAVLAIGLLMHRVKQSEQKSKETEAENKSLQQELKQAAVIETPAWLPYWWFPPKNLGTLANDEQRKQYTVPEGKANAFRGMVRGEDAPDLFVDRARGRDGPDQQVRLKGTEILVSPEAQCFFGDVDAELAIAIKEWAPDRRLRVGLQSVAKGFDGIPFLAEFGGGSVRVIGPMDLFSHTSLADGDRKSQTPLRLEVKAEKDAPELVPGQYTLKFHREGTAMSFKLTGPQGFAAVSVEIKDLNLSNWVFKNTQLVVRQPPAGVQFAGAEVRRRYGGGELSEAVRHFREGEYSVAETESKVIAAGERGETHSQKARALFHLGLIQEICQPHSGRERAFYTDGLTELDQVVPDETRTPEKAQELARLATELHFRRLLRFAKDRRWPDVTNELYLGWSQENRIGEPLAWELHRVLELALHAPPPKDPAVKDTERAAGLKAALQVFERAGLEPGSARFARSAGDLAAALAGEQRFEELARLRDAYPARTLGGPFLDAVLKALELEQLDTALGMFKKMDSRMEADTTWRARAALVAAAMKARRYADAGALYTAAPSMPLLKLLCKEIEQQAKSLAEDEASFYGFLPRVLTPVAANLPQDPAAAGVLNDALGKLAAEIVNSGRVTKLVKVHEALRSLPGRGTALAPSDPRLAGAFADAVARLAAVPGPGAEAQALSLLRYCALHVNAEDRALQRAVGAFARRRGSVDDARSYGVILTLQKTYPSPELLTQAGDVLREMRQHNRFEEMVIFYSQARVEFGRDARALTPFALAALENVSSPDQRAQLMKSLWFTVQGEFEQRQMAAAGRQWHLEYADMELALNQWDKARERYQALYKNKDIEPELLARVALRLAVLQFTRPAAGSAAEILLPVLALEKLPPAYRLAARLLATPDQLRLEDLDPQLKTLGEPVLLTEAEWDLVRGVRLRMDGNQAAARDVLAGAARKSDPSRAWVNSVASHLLRAGARSPDDEAKGENDKPADRGPQPPAPSLKFPKVAP